ncbi:unnamed protein product [Blepharisma stoltei]|uniref:Alpha/beta hydrolase n=1 Tax=Blepharisma stoltei TaxID=1481888 RepID=A0AAU9K2E6_9CILI|nr:unnamed protein product [Blepharisma stoltei]
MELNNIIFPSPKPSYDNSTFRGETIWIPRASNPLNHPIPCIYLPCNRGSSKVLLYFHGNAEDLGLCYHLIEHLRSTLSVHVIGVEYPGYGIYPGKCSAKQVLIDADDIFQYLVQEMHINTRDIIVFGRSIGSGPATWLAANRNPGALLLMSAYTSIKAAVKKIAGRLAMKFVKERFKNIDLMPKITCPTFLIHGQKDNLIAWENSQQLHDLCPGPCCLLLPKEMTHNEFDFFDDLSLPFAAFLMQCGISVNPGAKGDSMLRFPESLYIRPENGENKKKGRWNRFLQRFA